MFGGSAGGVEAMLELLPSLPENLSSPIIIVLHQLRDGKSLLTEIFQHTTRIPVKEAESGELPVPGKIYIAPPDYHLAIERDGTLSLSNDELIHYSRPAINVLFESGAEVYGPEALGILLTGANEDGADGIKKIIDNKGLAIVQDPRTAKFTEMPQFAISRAKPQLILSLDEIKSFLRELK